MLEEVSLRSEASSTGQGVAQLLVGATVRQRVDSQPVTSTRFPQACS